MVRRLWEQFDHDSRIALIIGIVLAVAAIPLPTWVAIVLGLGAALVLGFTYPDEAGKVGALVALPILVIAFLFGFVRGFSVLVLLVVLVPSVILPVYLARIGAAVRSR